MLPLPILSKEEIVRLRNQHLSPSLSLSYSCAIPHGLHIVRGKNQYLYDEQDTQYLDCRNNVQHIGHSHEIITQCVAQQMSLLNTNTRYLHENVVLYAQRLASLLPAPLQYTTFVNSGSEANEFALRLCTSYTQRKHLIAFEHGYHGNTTSTINVSHYKLIDQPSKPLPVPKHVHFAPIPDKYRGKHMHDVEFNRKLHKTVTSREELEDAICDYYIEEMCTLIDRVDPNRDQIAGIIAESVIGCGGQIFLPRHFLWKCKQLLVAKYGADKRPLMIMDEVQCGFGRLGAPYFWAFQHNSESADRFVPDILTLGKSMGNGFPLAGTVTTKRILTGFKRNNYNQEYFNTFGGNPVAAIVGLNVLNIIQQNNYLQHVAEVGTYFMKLLETLQREVNGHVKSHVYIGDVRGKGLFIGIELVTNLQTMQPAQHETELIVNRLAQKPYCLLLSTDGPFESVIKIKPPICFTKKNAETVVQSLRLVLSNDALFCAKSKL